MKQESKGYSEQSGLVWDIYDERNRRNYQHLTETHIREYGRPDIFHTIGLAERSLREDREKGFLIKKYAYDMVTEYVREKYPKAPILVAAWDFYFTYQADEVRRMIRELDPETHIILDYTVDLKRTQNDFEQWGVVGRFPYIFGIFHSYEPQSHIHGDYAYLDQKLKVADADPFCKGMAFWPELSHSDTFMLEYFADNSWRPEYLPLEKKADRFCQRRYGANEETMREVWRAFLPLYALTEDQGYYMSSFFYFFGERRIVQRLLHPSDPAHERALADARRRVAQGKKLFSAMRQTVEKLALLPSELLQNEFIARDCADLLRSVAERRLDVEVLDVILSWMDGKDWGDLEKQREKCLLGMDLFSRILACREEFSAFHTMEKLKETAPVNPFFEKALKENMVNGYCRSSVCEVARFVYLPEMKALFDVLSEHRFGDSLSFSQARERILDAFSKKTLREMRPEKEELLAVCRAFADGMLQD